MFSGIVEELGTVQDVEISGDNARLTIAAELFTGASRKVGDSVCISGVCLTIVHLDISRGEARFDLASETRRCTTLGGLERGSRVNLEPSLRVGDQIHGHFVQGHVDSMSVLRERSTEENTLRLVFSLPAVIADLVSPKGSVTLDGVSLTVGEVRNEDFSVYIIPHTAAVTTLGSIDVGGRVNVEADCLARYVRTILERSSAPL